MQIIHIGINQMVSDRWFRYVRIFRYDGEAHTLIELIISNPPTTSPDPIDPGLWLLVAAAALSAMHHGRKVMYATNKTELGPRHIHIFRQCEKLDQEVSQDQLREAKGKSF